MSYISGLLKKSQAAENTSSTNTKAGIIIFNCRGTLYTPGKDVHTLLPVGSVGGCYLTLKDITRKEAEGEKSFILELHEAKESGDTVGPVEEPMLQQQLSPTMYMRCHHQTGLVQWYCYAEDKLIQCFFKFTVEADARKAGITSPSELSKAFEGTFQKCLYDQMDAAADDADDVSYMKRIFTQEEDNVRSETTLSPEPERVDENDKEEEESYLRKQLRRSRSVVPPNSFPNICFADSVTYNRAVVIGQRGDELELRAHLYEGDKFVSDSADATFLVNGLKNLHISQGNITRCSLTNQEKSLFVTVAAKDRATTGGYMFLTDMEKQSVVSNYSAPEDFSLVNALPQHKNEGNPVLMCGLATNVAFTWDTRMDPKRAVVAEAGKSTGHYAIKTGNFTCHATSANGHLVIGDKSGAIRLYTGPPGSERPSKHDYHPKTAKTSLPGPTNIVAIDITKNAEYVVAATKEVIVVFPLQYMDDDGKSANGCEKRMGKKKPPPLGLMPSPEQIQQMRGVVNFSSVQFDNNDNDEESIVAISNEHILMWSMRSVKKALENNRATLGDGVKESGSVQQVLVSKGNKLFFMTENEVGLEAPLAEKKQELPRRNKNIFRFGK